MAPLGPGGASLGDPLLDLRDAARRDRADDGVCEVLEHLLLLLVGRLLGGEAVGAVDTHRNILAEAKTFLQWCVNAGWLRSDPAERLKGVGKRKHGKPRLRVDEARKWIAKAKELAHGGDVGAVAAMMSLLMGMRATEIIERVGRDVDDEGTLLWITKAKTDAGRRNLQIPWMLQPHLRKLKNDIEPDALIFGHHYRDWPRENVQRICRLAQVPTVTAHGMRGLHASLAVDSGVTAPVVASALGHESFSTTQQSYAKQGAIDGAKQKRALRLLTGPQDGNASAAGEGAGIAKSGSRMTLFGIQVFQTKKCRAR
jgi:integrase